MVCHAGLAPGLDVIDAGALTDVIVTNGTATLDKLTVHAAGALLAEDDRVSPDGPVRPWDSQYIIFTSGTTGPSKAVLSSYIHNFATAPESYTFVGGGDRILVNLPMFHMGGTMFINLALAHGGSAVVVESFRTEEFWPTIHRHQITFACFLGAMAPFLLKPPPSDQDKAHPLRSVVCIPWNEDALALSQRFGFEMRTVFNMTETSVPLVSDVNPQALGTCGKPRPGVEVRVVDENDC
jgi:crotonobetaine/carnitine-CoA ligase